MATLASARVSSIAPNTLVATNGTSDLVPATAGALTTLSTSGLATLASAKVTGLTASQLVSTDGSSNLVSVAYPLPTTARFNQETATVVAGAAFTFGISATVFYSMQIYQNPSVINDSFSQKFLMLPGAYTLYVMGYEFSNRGIISWYIDGVLQGADDWYAGVGANVIQTVAVTVVGNSEHTLRGIVASKNGLSTGYVITILDYWIK